MYQQGTFASSTANFWMGSIATDKIGDMALGFSASSSATYPSIMYTGRVPTDPLGTSQGSRQESAADIVGKQNAVTQVLCVPAASCIMDRIDGPDSWL